MVKDHADDDDDDGDDDDDDDDDVWQWRCQDHDKDNDNGNDSNADDDDDCVGFFPLLHCQFLPCGVNALLQITTHPLFVSAYGKKRHT